MRRDPASSYDGFTKITAGVQSASAPIALPRSQLAWATNIECRTDFMRPRPGWQKRPLTFLDSAGAPSPAVAALFEDAIYEGAIVFERFSQLVVMVGGHLFKIDPSAWTVTDVSTPGDYNAPNIYRAWFCEAESWIIAQDGSSIPWIYDGASATRSDTLGAGGRVQVPIGKVMCYSQGRLIVAYASGRAFVVGDIVGGASGTAPYDFKDSVLCFTENNVINGGGSFSVPINSGLITAFRPIAQIDTSMGQGPTQVFTTGAVFSLNLPVDRATWQTVNFPIGTVSNVANGATSDRCTPNVNGDIWFRAPDGIRAFLVARRDFQAAWINAPLSQEVSRAIDGDDENLLGYASAVYFDQRLLCTTRPYRVWNHGIPHQGLVQLDFQPVATLSERNPLPTWLGNATGVRPLQVLSGTLGGVPRSFIFALSVSDKVELWEVTKKAAADDNGAVPTPIQWSFETGAFSFAGGDAGASALPGRELWSLDGGRLFVDEIEGTVTFALQWRPDQDPCWHDWHAWSVCASDTTCLSAGADPAACLAAPPNLRQQYRRFFNLPAPRGACDTVVDKPPHIGREFQVRAVITGRCRVKMLELVAHAQEEDITGVCAASEACVAVSCCPPDDYAYLIPPGGPPVVATGACCVNNTCTIASEAACLAAGGVYQGDNVACAADLCDLPTGACCLDGACSIVTEAECLAAGGAYLGDATSCEGDPCFIPEPTGACCIGGRCAAMTEFDCLTAQGVYLGDYASCQSTDCVSPPNLPVWPAPDPYACEGRGVWGPIAVDDPLDFSHAYVAINPGGLDPLVYFANLGFTPVEIAAIIASWSMEVWAQFIATGTPYTSARLIWYYDPITGLNFAGSQVFPAQAGGYGHFGSLDTWIAVEYCPDLPS